MLDIIFFILTVIVITFIVIENIRLKNKNLELLFLITQLNIDLESIKKKVKLDDIVEKDHLISFLTETRDIAYSYIEEVHEELIKFKEVIEKETLDINEKSLSKIENAFKELKKIYPQEIKND